MFRHWPTCFAEDNRGGAAFQNRPRGCRSTVVVAGGGNSAGQAAAQLFYFMGEVETVFGIWLIPLFVAITAFHGWATMVEYVGNVNVADAIFVVVIMAMASSLPIIRFTETVIAKVSAVRKEPPLRGGWRF
jgi:hypothetical protein